MKLFQKLTLEKFKKKPKIPKIKILGGILRLYSWTKTLENFLKFDLRKLLGKFPKKSVEGFQKQ